MQSDVTVPAVSTKALWTGRVISGLLVLFLLFDSVVKFFPIPPVVEAFQRLGYSPSLATWLGATLLTCTILYVIPRTSVLGAILLTAYLGGATATHVRADDPFLFPVVFGVLAWLGLYLRDVRLRVLVPVRG